MEAVAERELLTADEVRDLTDCKPWAKQAAWLAEHGVPHRVDGRRVIVSRMHLRGWLEGKPMASGGGINFAAIK